MLKLFPITNANRKWVAAFGENWSGGVGTAKVGWLVGWLIDKETVTDTIDVYGSTLSRSFEPWQHHLLLPLTALGCCQLTYENDFRFDCVPHSPADHKPHPSIECQLVDCLPNCHSLFPFPIKALANSFESPASDSLPYRGGGGGGEMFHLKWFLQLLPMPQHHQSLD